MLPSFYVPLATVLAMVVFVVMVVVVVLLDARMKYIHNMGYHVLHTGFVHLYHD